MVEVIQRHPAFQPKRRNFICGECYQLTSRDGEHFCLEHLVKLGGGNRRRNAERCIQCKFYGKPGVTAEKLAKAYEDRITHEQEAMAAPVCRGCPSIEVVCYEQKVPPFRTIQTARRKCGWYGDELVSTHSGRHIERCLECLAEGRVNQQGEPYQIPIVGICRKKGK